ncbi:hypothetical protein [Actinophytocola xanthii]|nr:hypothetical protein [Actinophytocola xanthii]
MVDITTLLAATNDEALSASGASDVDFGVCPANSLVCGGNTGG